MVVCLNTLPIVISRLIPSPPPSDVDCGRVTALLRGSVSYDNDTTFLGSVVRHTCNENYR